MEIVDQRIAEPHRQARLGVDHLLPGEDAAQEGGVALGQRLGCLARARVVPGIHVREAVRRAGPVVPAGVPIRGVPGDGEADHAGLARGQGEIDRGRCARLGRIGGGELLGEPGPGRGVMSELVAQARPFVADHAQRPGDQRRGDLHASESALDRLPLEGRGPCLLVQRTGEGKGDRALVGGGARVSQVDLEDHPGEHRVDQLARQERRPRPQAHAQRGIGLELQVRDGVMAPVVDFSGRLEAVEAEGHGHGRQEVGGLLVLAVAPQGALRAGGRRLVAARPVLGLRIAQEPRLAARAQAEDRHVQGAAARDVGVVDRRVAQHAAGLQVHAAGVDPAQGRTVGHQVAGAEDDAAGGLGPESFGGEAKPLPAGHAAREERPVRGTLGKRDDLLDAQEPQDRPRLGGWDDWLAQPC